MTNSKAYFVLQKNIQQVYNKTNAYENEFLSLKSESYIN